MLRHLLKRTWKRKTRTLMLSMEIMLAFVIVFASAASGVRSWQLYHQPLGFQPHQRRAEADHCESAGTACDARHIPRRLIHLPTKAL